MLQLTTITGAFDDLKDCVAPIRYAVFVEEQNVPIELEQDERDLHCEHVLISHDLQPIATGRIDLDRGGKIGRVAVLAEYRRRKVGRAIMQVLEQIAARNNLIEVFLNSQVEAVPFYRQLGYVVDGEQFSEAGIMHLKMTKKLEPIRG